MGLRAYRDKRDFAASPEPAGRSARAGRGGGRFVVQKHDATRLHYDFRLELDGVLKSWAVPKGPSFDPAQKRLAVEVEDHPVEYRNFEGVIPDGHYGAGPVVVWDRGRWRPDADPRAGLKQGHLKFHLEGEKLGGGWALIRMRGPRMDDGRNWLLVKERDEFARKGRAAEVVARRPESVASGRTIEELPARKRAARTRRAPPPARGSKPALRNWLPELATLTTTAPEGDGWLHEIKFDGYRIVCRVADGRATLFSRSGLDWTRKFPAIASAAAALPVRSALLDGEVVVLTPNGVSSFQALQNALHDPSQGEMTYFVFDLIEHDGKDLRAWPLEKRKAELARLVGKVAAGSIRYSDRVRGKGEAFFAEACRRGLAGIVSKPFDAPARSGRAGAWRKIKCGKRQEVVIGGFTEGNGARKELGALLVGVREGRTLRYAGRVGTGFADALLRDLRARLGRLEIRSSPFATPPRRLARTHCVRPALVCEVDFTEWTADGLMRHPSFVGLREDKPAKQVVRERAVRPPGGATRVEGIALTHPDKVLYPDRKLTKLDLARYFATVADRMVPQIAGRPLMLLRCPGGAGKPCFFQKHPQGTIDPSLASVDIEEKSGPHTYVTVSDARGLVALLQGGALELHVWGARADRIEQPDRMVFDIDPDPRTPWPEVPRTALRLRDALAAFDLASFVKTSGGKGFHVVVPLTRGAACTWETMGHFALDIAARLVRESPDLYTTHLVKERRKGRIFLDTLRNRRAHTWVAPYSPRARAGAPVSFPVSWSEVVPALHADRFTVEALARGLPRTDPWKDLAGTRQTITAAMRKAVGRSS